MLDDTSDKVVLVTGAARRIGAQIVRNLHGRGCRVVIHCHRSEDEAAALAASLEQLRPDSVRVVRADLRDVAVLPGLVERAVGFWGRLDGLVNNASVFYPTPFASASEGEWDDVIGSNLKAPFFLAKAVTEPVARQGGAIVNIVDIYADRSPQGYAIYTIAKAGLAAMTRALAVELASVHVTVNGVAPGAILWPEQGGNPAAEAAILAKVPLGRTGTPEDIARAVVFLMLDAPYVTGQILAVDGGRSLFI